LTFIRSATLNAAGLLSQAQTLFSLAPAVIGGVIYAALYNDEVSAHMLARTRSLGYSALAIVGAKLLLSILIYVLVFAIAPLVMLACALPFGITPLPQLLVGLYALSLKAALMSIGFGLLSAAVAYTSGRSTFAIVCYLLLGFGIVSSLLNVALTTDTIQSLAPNLNAALFSTLCTSFSNSLFGVGSAPAASSLLVSLIGILIWYLIGIIAATIALSRRELEV
jgi:hypothetical protein